MEISDKNITEIAKVFDDIQFSNFALEGVLKMAPDQKIEISLINKYVKFIEHNLIIIQSLLKK